MKNVVHLRRRDAGVVGFVFSVTLGLALALCCSSALALNEHVFASSFAGAGSGAGQISSPTGIAVNDATHDVYVLDSANNRVEEFSSSGAFIAAWGYGVSDGADKYEICTSSCRAGIAGEGPGQFYEPTSIAIDNSGHLLTDPSAGDVYVVNEFSQVVQKFSSSGIYIGSPISSSNNEVLAVTVDPNGELWYYTQGGTFYNYNDAVANESIASRYTLGNVGRSEQSPFGGVLALDGADNIYVARSGDRGVLKLNSSGATAIENMDPEEAPGIASESPSDVVYVDNVTHVAAFNSAGEPLPQATFGAGQITSGSGVAVDSSTGVVYVADRGADQVEAFSAVVLPDVATGKASDLQVEGSATLGGTVNPDGEEVSECYFEYGTETSYGQKVSCAQTPKEIDEMGKGGSPVAVSANVTGLTPDTLYHFRLVAADANGTNPGADRTFIAPATPTVGEESVLDVASSSATLDANINAGGAETTYHFEYGTTSSYGESLPVPDGDAGSGLAGVTVSVHPQDLQPSTLYHYRVVASNLLSAAVPGPDQTFTTHSAGGEFALPDGRAYELVSPPSKNGAVIEPVEERGGIVEAAEDGSAITYLSAGPIVTDAPSNTNETQIISRRAPGGRWSSLDISTRHDAPTQRSVGAGQEYRFFSPDLAHGLIQPLGETRLSPEALNKGGDLYLTDDQKGGPYEPLLTTTNVAPTVKSGEPIFVGASPDLSHVVLSSSEALTSTSAPNGGLYEWSGGQLQLVSVLPKTPAYPLLGYKNGDVRHAISNDGSRIFWSAEGHLYMRDMVTKETVQIDANQGGPPPGPEPGEAQFQTASSEGSRVFFTDAERLTEHSTAKSGYPPASDLYEYDVESGKLTDLTVDPNTGESAAVQGAVLGASEDGSYVYIVANGVLAPGAAPGNCEQFAPAGATCNLYAMHDDGTERSTTFIRALSSEDEPDWAGGRSSNLEHLSARVSPSGRYLAFMSDQRLTGYDNIDANSGAADEEVYLYDAVSNSLVCASCNPTGARPVGLFDTARKIVDYPRVWSGHWLAASVPGWTPMELLRAQYQPRYLSDSGRLFFDSADALVPKDTNGLEDVYQYEPERVGSCARSNGCVALITPGTSGRESAFLDASASGGDVFFLTAQTLVPEDYDTAFDVYDAHVCTPAAPCPAVSVATPPCSTAESCRSAPAPQPSTFGPPPSETFSDAGSVTSTPTPTKTVKPKAKTASQIRAEKLAKALKACKRKPKSKRKGCEAQARKNYGPTHKAKKPNRRAK